MDRFWIHGTLVFWTMVFIGCFPAWISAFTGNNWYLLLFLISIPLWLWSTTKIADKIDDYLDKHGK